MHVVRTLYAREEMSVKQAAAESVVCDARIKWSGSQRRAFTRTLQFS